MNDTTRPAIGQPAPGLTLPADGGPTLSLALLRGSAVVPGHAAKALSMPAALWHFHKYRHACHHVDNLTEFPLRLIRTERLHE